MSKIFIVDEFTQLMLIKIPEIQELVKKLNNTEDEELQEQYTEKIEEIIKEKFDCEEVQYAI